MYRVLAVFILLFVGNTLVADDDVLAEKLVASKKRSDMTYKQLMQRMGVAYEMMQNGVINQNKELVRLGASMIKNHPAPKYKPWTIVKQENQMRFKQTLLAYDKLLHASVDDIEKSLQDVKNDWSGVNKSVYALSNNCVSCHSVWKR